MVFLSASPVPEPSRLAAPLRLVGPRRAPVAVFGSSYNDVRQSLILIEHERETGALLALLRIEPAEHPSTRDVLRRLGFHPNASPERWSISWRRHVGPNDLHVACRSVFDALGDEAVLAIGASFAPRGSRPLCVSRLPTFWPGRFLLHVGGTRRCVLFGASVDEHALSLVFDAEHDAYFAHDFVPATE
jgi:hypothetical protein